MEQRKSVIYFLYCLLCIYISVHGSIIVDTENREWEIASNVYEEAQVAESNICTVLVDAQTGYIGTYTAINALNNTVDIVSALANTLKSILDVIQYDLVTIISKVDVIDNETSIIDQQLESIQVNDFGGTWTALDNLEQVLCNKLETAFDNVAVIESKIDKLTVDNLVQFITTFTKVNEISINVINTMTVVYDLSEQLIYNVTYVDDLINAVQMQLMTIDSNVFILNSIIHTGFSGTFTVIQDILNDFIITSSNITYLSNVFITEFANTFTAIVSLEQKATTIESKIDVALSFLDTIQIKADTISSYIDVFNVHICTIDSKIDQLLSKDDILDASVSDLILDLVTINSKVNLIDAIVLLQTVCTLDSKVDYLSIKETTIESKITIVDARHNTVHSVLDLIVHTADTTLSKLCIIDSKVDIVDDQITTIQSSLDRIYTINSKIDFVDQSTDTISDQWDTLNSKIDYLDSSIDHIACGMRSTESKGTTIQSVVDVLDGRLTTINSLVDTITTQVDTLISTAQTIESKLCVIESICEETNSDLDTMSTRLNSANVNARERSIDFQETWTIIDSIQRFIISTQSQASTVSSSFDTVQIIVDINGTYTAIEGLNRQEFTIESKVDRIQESLNKINLLAYKGSFTMLNEVLTKLSEVDSLIDLLSVTVTALATDAFGCTGIPIYQSSIPYTISSPGHYYLAEDIKATAGGNMITISGDNVALNLNGKVLNGNSLSRTINVTGTRTNIAIFNGRTNLAAGDALLIGDVTNFLLEDVLIANSLADAVNFGGSLSTNLLIRRVIVQDTASDGWDMEDGIVNGLIEDLHVLVAGDGGIDFPNAGGQNLILRNCSVDSANRGINFQGTRCVAEYCRATNISGGGIILGGSKHVARNCTVERCTTGISAAGTGGHVIINNDITQNSGSGIANSGANNVILFNRLVNNGTNISGAGVGTILGNYAINATTAANYSISGTVITGALSTVQHSKPFPTPTPTYWYNINAIP